MGVNISFIKLLELVENNNNIKLIASEKISFPVADMESYDETAGEIYVNFMGLKGVDSPLPVYITQNKNLEYILNNISHKLYKLFYLGLKKYFCAPKLIQPSFNYSRENLYKNIKNYLGDNIEFEIIDFVLGWNNLSDNNITLGKTNLGEGMLGDKILSQNNKIIIKIGPVKLSQAILFRNDQKLGRIILDNVAVYNKYKLKFKFLTSRANHVVIGQWILH